MRKTVIYCDKCGIEILGRPVQFIPEYYDRDEKSHEPFLGDEELPPSWRKMLAQEFCEKCAEKIFDYALNSLNAEKEPDQEENESSSNGLDYSEALDRINSEKYSPEKKKVLVSRHGISLNGRKIWSNELFPYIGSMVDLEITDKRISVKDGKKALFTIDLPN